MIQRRTALLTPALAMPWLHAAAAAPDLPVRLQALLDDAAAPLASLVVWARRRDGRSLNLAFGRRRIVPGQLQLDLPADTDTLFRMASISKLAVALVVLRLLESGRLSLDADVQTWLGRQLRNPRHPEVPLTLRQLLSHRSSIVDIDETYPPAGQSMWPLFAPGSKAWSDRTPGSFFQYSNLGFSVVAAVLERASGERFDRLMQRELFAPLGLQGGFEPAALPPGQQGRIATLYRRPKAGDWVAQTDDFRSAPPVPTLNAAQAAAYTLADNGSLFGPQGRMRTRVADLGTLAELLLARGQHRGHAFLKPESIALMLTEQWRFDPARPNGDDLGGEFQAWGLGLQHVIDVSRPGNKPQGDRLVPGLTAWGHPGFAWGLHSQLMVAPERGSAVAFAVGGTTVGPNVSEVGRYSSRPVWEEKLNELLWAYALA